MELPQCEIAEEFRTWILSKADLEFHNETGEVFKIKTDINMQYRERIHPDIYSISVTHSNFQPFLIEGQKILPGEMRIENFELSRLG
ncbi:MAG: hypothetical protein ABI855_20015 [Bacteroidota bacterium]